MVGPSGEHPLRIGDPPLLSAKSTPADLPLQVSAEPGFPLRGKPLPVGAGMLADPEMEVSSLL